MNICYNKPGISRNSLQSKCNFFDNPDQYNKS